ncbi:MAG: methyltransferase domain-containing protein [Brachymonas sp.]|nr:methyltransferase domain-containing protein [Brachymonas sp.]
MNQGCERDGEQDRQKAGQIIDLAQWFACASGRDLQAWSQARCDQASANCFGWHALQLGLPAWPLLRNCRVQQHWVAAAHAAADAGTHPAASPGPAPDAEPHAVADVDVALDWTALPFAESSIDLIVLPYALEASGDPHTALREAARVLVPEGHLLILGFNPASLWGLQRNKQMLAQRFAGAPTAAPHAGQPLAQAHPLAPQARQWVGHRRLRDWLQLLGFEISAGRFGCYRPIVRSQRWFNRLHWLEAAGDRWWPFLGGVYFLHVIKRVHGARLLRPGWSLPARAAPATNPIARGPHAAAPHPNTCKP